jgi:poly(A) polymerase
MEHEQTVVVDQALMCTHAGNELEQLHELGLLSAIFPEVAAMVGFGGGKQGHKDLWWHTKLVVEQCIKRRPVRWAALFHDVGKVPTFSREGGKVSFHGHELVSARLFDQAARRIELEAGFRKHVRFLIRHLGHVESYESEWTDSAVRRLHRDTAEHFDDLLALARADITTKHGDKRRRHHERVKELADRAAEIAQKDAELPWLPKGLGTALIRELGIAAGPGLGRLMKALEAAAQAGDVAARADEATYVAFVRSSGGIDALIERVTAAGSE